MHVAGKDHSTGDERKRYYAKAEGMRMAISRSTTPPPNFPPKTDQRTEGES